MIVKNRHYDHSETNSIQEHPVSSRRKHEKFVCSLTPTVSPCGDTRLTYHPVMSALPGFLGFITVKEPVTLKTHCLPLRFAIIFGQITTAQSA
jgi:hypothetical protein